MDRARSQRDPVGEFHRIGVSPLRDAVDPREHRRGHDAGQALAAECFGSREGIPPGVDIAAPCSGKAFRKADDTIGQPRTLDVADPGHIEGSSHHLWWLFAALGLVLVDDLLGAVDPATRKVAWKRPIKDSAQLVGVDQENCYLLSRELECIDRATQKLRWSIELPISGGGLSLAPTTAGLLVFTSRGLFEVNRSDGSILRIFRGHDLGSSGGAIQTIGDRAICVSNRAVTMYALGGKSE